jgi:para-aminobenzoate synthetase component 1
LAVHLEPLEPAMDAERVARALQHRTGLAWLDGDGRGPEGRFSFVASDPARVRRVPFGSHEPLGVLAELEDPPDRGAAAHALPAHRIPHWIGYVAYDATWSGATRTPRRIPREAEPPVLWLGRYDAVVAFDHTEQRTWLAGDDAAACARLRTRILEGAPDERPTAMVGEPEAQSAASHARAVEAALESIAAGDIYQVNLARRWSAPFEGSPLALWEAMRQASPVPLGMFVGAGDHAVLGRTMERFLRWDRESARLTTKPIKGTIARRGDQDAAEADVLRGDEKERAEHAMIVDLMRNDLGRVARTGSVEVRDRMTVEPYAKLSHLVSTVTCETRPGVTLADVFGATFPPGSVTGCPKIRAIEIIEALEPYPRGVYTGCVGYVDRAGGASFAVAIRTSQLTEGWARYHAGGGLVAASIPDKEVAETDLKARAFLDAVQALQRG